MYPSFLLLNYELLLLGDFNVDFLASNKTKKICTRRRKMKNFAIANDLEQLIAIPTRITEFTKSAIDLIFVDNKHRIVSCGTIVSSLVHQIIFCIVKSGVQKGPPKIIEYRSLSRMIKMLSCVTSMMLIGITLLMLMRILRIRLIYGQKCLVI